MENNEVRVKVPGGTLVAKESNAPLYPGIAVDFVPDGAAEEDFAPVALVEADGKKLSAFVWDNMTKDEYSHEISIKNIGRYAASVKRKQEGQ